MIVNRTKDGFPNREGNPGGEEEKNGDNNVIIYVKAIS